MTEIKIELDAVTVCRICLQSSEEEMSSIFDRESPDSNMCLYEKIEKCGGIKILSDPELPSKICNKCKACLSIAHKFRVICKNSDDYLREFVCKSTRINAPDEEDGVPEYLFDYSPETTNIAQPADDDTQTTVDYEEIDGYTTELWINEEGGDEQIKNEVLTDYDIIEEDHYDDDEDEDDDGGGVGGGHSSSKQSNSSASPSKTLGISSDGTAVIRMKSERQMNKEKQVHICDICGNTYPRKYALEAHMRRHRNERPFECEICHQSFHLNFQLTRHIRKHTGVRPYSCQYCKRQFSDRSTMVKHERIHRNERPYTCETCGKSFTYSSVLKVHMLTHTGEKPFNCGICGKRFSRAHHLRAHLETLLHQNDPRSKILLKQIRREEEYTRNYSNDELIGIS